MWLHGQFFDQSYNYGTTLRTSHTDAGLVDLSGTLRTDDGSEWQAMLFSNQQSFKIQFSEALDDARTNEGLSLKQKVPFTDVGASLVWSRRMLNPLLLSAGVDLHWIDGQSRDQIFDPDTGSPDGSLRSDGKQFFARVLSPGYLHAHAPVGDCAQRARRSVEQLRRHRHGYAPTTRDHLVRQPHPCGVQPPPQRALPPTDWLHLRAAAYRAFRAPTLAELYRQSYVEGLQFRPNPEPQPGTPEWCGGRGGPPGA